MKIKKTSIIAMALALALSIGLIPVNAYAAQAQDQPKAEQVAASINYDITVTFNGEAKALSNVNGQQVYPVLYGGTTYVPIRAIGYLLGLNVDWDQATRTVLLDKPANGQTADIKTAKPDDPKKTGTQAIRPTIDPGITVKYNGEAQTMKTATGAVVYPMIDGGTTYLPIRAVSNMLGLDVDWEQATQTVKLTSANAANEYLELDWSTANDGYIRVKVADNASKYLMGVCKITYVINEYGQTSTDSYELKDSRWYNVPLKGGDTEYAVILSTKWKRDVTMPNDVWERMQNMGNPMLTARFTPQIKDPDAVYLLSTPEIDFENAPNTRAKALEITKNCKTDAEKITVIFNWVSQNIRYDHKMAEAKDGIGEQHDLDKILADKSGVCEHYAVLMAGMLRSVGVECQVVNGSMKVGSQNISTEDPYAGYTGHAWVAVKPKTGKLDMAALGAGKDQDCAVWGTADGYEIEYTDTGWIRLDPTNAGSPNTSIDSRYRAGTRS